MFSGLLGIWSADMAIDLGPRGVIGIIVTLAVIAIGMVILLRSQASDAAE